MYSVTSTLATFGHIATRRQLIASGLSGFDLTLAVKRGEVRRVRQAHYATSLAEWDAVVATRVGGRLCGISAARSFGLWAGFDPRLHVVVPTNASRLRAANEAVGLVADIDTRPIALHWIDVPQARECWRVPIGECLTQVAGSCDTETAIACLDTVITAFGERLVRESFAGSHPRLRLLAAHAVPGSDSGPESIVRQRLNSVGIVVRQQVMIAGVGRVDMMVKGTRVVIEVDGRAYHSSPERFENDRRRSAELIARKYIEVRLSYEQIIRHWPWCLAMIRAALS